MKYMGIDYHKQYFVATTMDEKGKVISKEKVSTDGDSMSWLQGLKTIWGHL